MLKMFMAWNIWLLQRIIHLPFSLVSQYHKRTNEIVLFSWYIRGPNISRTEESALFFSHIGYIIQRKHYFFPSARNVFVFPESAPEPASIIFLVYSIAYNQSFPLKREIRKKPSDE